MKSLMVLLLLAVLASPTFAGNDPPPESNILWGFYFSDFTLTASAPGPDYYVIGDMFIQPGVTMTVEPGVNVYFAANRDTLNGGDFFNESEIISEGTIHALGNQLQPIRFTSAGSTQERGDWGQIKLLASATGTFDHCVIEYAVNALNMTGSGTLTVTNCSIRQCGGTGTGANGGRGVWATAGSVSIHESTIEHTDGFGVDTSNLSTFVCERNRIRFTGYVGVGCYQNTTSNILLNEISQISATGIAIANGDALVAFNRVSSTAHYGIATGGPHPNPVIVLGDTVEATGEAGILIGIGTADTVRGCWLQDIPSHDGVLVKANGAVVENCLGIRVDRGVRVDGTDVSVRYCTFSECRVGVYQDLGNSTSVRNVISVNNTIFGFGRSTGLPMQIAFCNLWNNPLDFDNSICIQGCVNYDPQFSDSQYHLPPGSPLRFLGEGGSQMGRYGPEIGDMGNALVGEYESDLTLTAASPGPDYYVLGDVIISPQATLTIQPGVSLRFAANTDWVAGGDDPGRAELLCRGTLIAIGSESQGILFTSDAVGPNRGDWGQIKLSDSATAALDYCEISYAMNGIHHNSSSSFSITNSVINECGSNGIWADLGSGAITNCRVDGIGGLNPIGGFGVIIETGASVVCERTTVRNVEKQGFRCLSAGNAVLRFNQIENTGTEGIWATGTNAKLHFNRVSGSGAAGIFLGSHSTPVTLVGDTVESSSATRGIWIEGGQADTVRTCLVRNLPAAHGVYIANSVGVSIEKSLVHHVDTHGIYIQTAPFTSITQTTISNCRSGIFVNSAESCDMRNVITVNNLWYGIEVVGAAPTVTYANSWNNGSGRYSGAVCATGCYSINPWFVDADYHLASNSPLRVLGDGGTQMGRYGPDPGDVTGVGHQPGEPYKVAYLLPNAPNPFRSWTAISFLAREAGSGTLWVYDISGRKVKEEPVEAIQGLNEIRFDRGELGPGLYFYRVALPGFAEVGKMVVVD